jgi:predicted ArsR family transcriptional regulator
MKEKIKLKQIKDHTERDVILLLKEKKQCMMGDIFMRLRLSYKKGREVLNSLTNKNMVSNREKAPYYTLKVDIE